MKLPASYRPVLNTTQKTTTMIKDPAANGVMGDATKATAEKGRKTWKIMIAPLVALVEELKEMSLEEIYQRKY